MRSSPRWRAALVASATTIVLAVLFVSRADAATLFSTTSTTATRPAGATPAAAGRWSPTAPRLPAGAAPAPTPRPRPARRPGPTTRCRRGCKPIAFNGNGAVRRRRRPGAEHDQLLLAGAARNAGRLELRRITGGGVTHAGQRGDHGHHRHLVHPAAGRSRHRRCAARSTAPQLGHRHGHHLRHRPDRPGRLLRERHLRRRQVVTDAAGPSDQRARPRSTPPVTSRRRTTTPPVTAAAGRRPDGFASVNALGQNGTTGGAGGPTVTVTTAAELADYAGRPSPYIIMVSGTISFDDMITVVANKTIIGVGSTAHDHRRRPAARLDHPARQQRDHPQHHVQQRRRTTRSASPTPPTTSGSTTTTFLPGFDGSLDVKRQSDLRHRVVEPLPRHGQDACCSATPTATPPTSATCG